MLTIAHHTIRVLHNGYVKTMYSQKGSHGKKKASPQKLPYEMTDEENRAVAAQQYDDWKKKCEEEKNRRRNFRKIHQSCRTLKND
jgi:hypothetical protein